VSDASQHHGPLFFDGLQSLHHAIETSCELSHNQRALLLLNLRPTAAAYAAKNLL
jgi:hypothetical protein